MASFKLYYFDFRARGELIRLVLAYAGKDYEDIRFSFQEWPSYKPEAPFGQAPYAVINGKKYAQSVALVNYLARENGLYGKTNVDGLRIDEVMGLAQDVWNVVGVAFREKDETKKAELEKKLMEEELPKYFASFDKLLRENGSNGVYVGKDVTLADLCAYDMIFTMNRMKNYDSAAAFPALKALRDRVASSANIKSYVAQRKDTDL